MPFPRLADLERDDLETMRAYPFLVARRGPDGVRVIGTPVAELGTPIHRNGVDEGIWVRWAWDGHRLEVRQSRFGFFPFFYFHTSDAWGIGPSIHQLVQQGAPRDLDDPAIAVFLRMGTFVGETTPFRAIRALPPGGELEADGLRLNVRVPQVPWQAKASSFSRAQAVEGFGELFQAAVERMVPLMGERPILPLSGGRDSRHIVLAMRQAGCTPPTAVTMEMGPPFRSDDVRYARVLAGRLGLSHHVLAPVTSTIRAEARKNVLSNLVAGVGGWIMPLRDFLLAQQATARPDGIAGDVMADFRAGPTRCLEMLLAGDLIGLAREELGPEGYASRLLTGEYRRRWSREAAEPLVVAELARHAETPGPYLSYFLWNRTRRAIAAGWTQLGGPWASLAPFLDHELYDFLASLPGPEYSGFPLRDVVRDRFFPEYADIPLAEGGWHRVPDRAYATREAGRLIAMLARGDGTRLVDQPYLVSRLAGAVGGWARQRASLELITRSVYLMQLARLAD